MTGSPGGGHSPGGSARSATGRAGAVGPSARTAYGRAIEARVGAALIARGHVLLGRNVRVGHDEVDLLVLDGGTLVIVEVRARSNAGWADAMHTVRAAKVRALKRAALALLGRGEHAQIRIDVVAVGVDGVEWITNAVDFSER